jgi:hypothetical protein
MTVLVTRGPQEFEYDVPVVEFSLIDASAVSIDDATLADSPSREIQVDPRIDEH